MISETRLLISQSSEIKMAELTFYVHLMDMTSFHDFDHLCRMHIGKHNMIVLVLLILLQCLFSTTQQSHAFGPFQLLCSWFWI